MGTEKVILDSEKKLIELLEKIDERTIVNITIEESREEKDEE